MITTYRETTRPYACSKLTEILRGRELVGYEEALAEVEKQYQITVDAIKALDA